MSLGAAEVGYSNLWHQSMREDVELTVDGDMMGGRRYYVGVDVGTYSVRAALVSANGRLEVTSAKAISVWEPSVDVYEQSSDEIWLAVCKVVKVSR